MQRIVYIERVLRQVYNGQPPSDATITNNLVNKYINEALAISAKQNYIESLKLDGVAYVNNGFYTTFKGLAITEDELFLYKITLPQMPLGIGRSEGVSSLKFKIDANEVSFPAIPLSEDQKGYYRSMRTVPNKLLYYQEGSNLFVISVISLIPYTAIVTMISGGDENDLESELNIPAEWYPTMNDYILKQLLTERNIKKDLVSDGTEMV